MNSKAGLPQNMPVAGRPDFLTGGSYGPDASILAGMAGAILIVGIWHKLSSGAAGASIIR